MRVSAAEAKASFADLLRRAEAGEEIEVTRYGKPVARLVAAAPVKRRSMFGAMRGQIWIAPGFDDPLPEFEESINAPIDPEP